MAVTETGMEKKQVNILGRQREVYGSIRELYNRLQLLIIPTPPDEAKTSEGRPTLANVLDEILEEQQDTLKLLVDFHEFVSREIQNRLS